MPPLAALCSRNMRITRLGARCVLSPTNKDKPLNRTNFNQVQWRPQATVFLVMFSPISSSPWQSTCFTLSHSPIGYSLTFCQGKNLNTGMNGSLSLIDPQNVGCRVFEINVLHVWFYFIFPIHYCGNIYCYGHNVLEALKHFVTCSQHKALLSYVSASHFQCHHEQHSCVFVRCSLTDKPDMDLVFTELIQSSCQSHLPVKLSQFSQSHSPIWHIWCQRTHDSVLVRGFCCA